MTRILALLAVLAFALPAFADPVRPFRSAWVVMDADCTDSYNLDATGAAPPAGGVDLTTLANWDTFAEAYSLQDNLGALPQTSGTADGLCDDAPWTLASSFTTVADNMGWIGPIRWPSLGGLIVQDYDVIGTDHQIFFMVELPYDANATTFASTAGANTSLARQIWSIGPEPEASASIEASDQLPFPTSNVYMVLNWDGAGTWTANIALIPYRGELYGRD